MLQGSPVRRASVERGRGKTVTCMEHVPVPSSLRTFGKCVSLAPTATLPRGSFSYCRDEETASQRLSALPKVILPPSVQSGLELRSVGLFPPPPNSRAQTRVPAPTPRVTRGGERGGEMTAGEGQPPAWGAFPPPAPAGRLREPCTAGLCALGKQPAAPGGRALNSHLLSKPL